MTTRKVLVARAWPRELRHREPSEREVCDWAGELVNQLLGRVKNALLPFGLVARAEHAYRRDRQARPSRPAFHEPRAPLLLRHSVGTLLIYFDAAIAEGLSLTGDASAAACARRRRSPLLRDASPTSPAPASIRAKLALLAGVPVSARLLLALFVVNDARQRATSAASLGSIEDLAQLSVVHRRRPPRRAGRARGGGDRRGAEAATPPKLDATPSIDARRETDAAAKRLESFLSTRDRSKLPPRLTERPRDRREAALRDLRRSADASTTSRSSWTSSSPSTVPPAPAS